jgi:D-aminopeptidase
VVGETNDGTLNDIRGQHVRRRHVLEAIRTAASGPVAQGNVGAGTGTTAFGWKGGIGTSSRVLPPSLGGWSVGVLVQTNYGGILDIAGVPVGKELRRYSYRDETSGGSCMIVVATDAPLHSAQLARLARRATLALGRTGSAMSNGSGDYVIAFSSTRSSAARAGTVIPDSRISPLFQAVVEATEEAIYNSLLKATSLRGYRASVVNALPIDTLTHILRAYGRLR